MNQTDPTIIYRPLVVSGGIVASERHEIVVNEDGSVTMPEGMTCGEALVITSLILTGFNCNNVPDNPFYADLIAKWTGFFAMGKPIVDDEQSAPKIP